MAENSKPQPDAGQDPDDAPDVSAALWRAIWTYCPLSDSAARPMQDCCHTLSVSGT